MKLNKKTQTFSSEYTFLQSNFDWLNRDSKQNFSIQSLVVSASVFNLKDDLLILDDLKKDYKDLGFELLVQRDINKKRVEYEIVENYLSVDGKTKFFPPIVVALIPSYKTLIDEHKVFTSEPTKTGENMEISIGEDSIIQTFLSVGESISEDFSKLFDSGDLKYGTFKWDKEKTNAIIIDGQHRFHALKKFLEATQGLVLSKCFFPVNFVVITPEFKKRLSVSKYIKLARELFIDINKNARQVSHTRQILLDDIDFFMVLTRNSIKQFNITENGKFIQWQEIEEYKYLNKIPQAVVNWNTDLKARDQDNIKLFRLAQITSTSLLFKVIKDFIFLPKKSESKNIFLTLLRVLELNKFATKPGTKDDEMLKELKIKAKLFEQKINDIENDIEEAKNDDADDNDILIEQYEKRITVLNENALSFDPKLNDWLTDWFYSRSKSGKFLTRFFSQFEPFHQTIEAIEPFFEPGDRDNKQIVDFLIDPLEKSSKSSYSSQFTSETAEENFYDLYENLERIKDSAVDVRYTVFQRAVFADLNKTIDLIEYLFSGEEFNLSVSKYIGALSNLYKKGVLKKDLQVSMDPPLFQSLGEKRIISEKAYLWRNILISDNNISTLKYRDSDAFKIADLLRILIIAELEQKPLQELKESHGGRITTYITTVRNLYKSSYEKEFKEKLELNNLGEVREKIDSYKFDTEVVRVLDSTIKNYILIN